MDFDRPGVGNPRDGRFSLARSAFACAAGPLPLSMISSALNFRLHMIPAAVVSSSRLTMLHVYYNDAAAGIGSLSERLAGRSRARVELSADAHASQIRWRDVWRTVYHALDAHGSARNSRRACDEQASGCADGCGACGR